MRELNWKASPYAKSYVIGKTDDLYPCVVTSQPWYRAATPADPHPSVGEIKDWRVVHSCSFFQSKNICVAAAGQVDFGSEEFLEGKVFG